MLRRVLSVVTIASTLLAASIAVICAQEPPKTAADERSISTVDYEIKLDTVLKHDDGKSLWFHPRVASIPGAGADGQPAAIMTIQKHLQVSDFYSGMSVMRTDDMGRSWSGPDAVPELDWVAQEGGVNIAVCDVTPGWHQKTGKYIAIGAQVRYSPQGAQLEDEQRSNQTAYAVFDPETGAWSRWQTLEMPPDAKFDYTRCACAQWLVEPDGTLLLPLYYGPSVNKPNSVTVARCSFDGEKLQYLTHGTELELDVVRGLCEPSLAKFNGRYYMTIRNDLKGYVTVSDDGLQFAPIEPWTFDDGTELGSYNTQQHWVTHSDGLFLTYTRSGANNDHMMRHRAPLFIAQVDPDKLQVIRSTERVLIPERGATLGNFGAAAISETESWVTVSEGVWSDDARKRGAEGATFVARVIWATPNRLFGAVE